MAWQGKARQGWAWQGLAGQGAFCAKQRGEKDCE